MQILVIGNLGYVGPVVVKQLRASNPESVILGFDIGYFKQISTDYLGYSENNLDKQYHGDVRKFPDKILEDTDSIVYLSAISNDPMGNEFEEVTYQINQKCALEIARMAKNRGVKNFIYASSCSVYGFAESGLRNENSELNPLTAYSKSKIKTEEGLAKIADSKFIISCLRFATACGFSPGMRLDLVLNDFVAGALTKNRIEILSDGRPWRPLIHVSDMARAIDWAVYRAQIDGKPFLSINVGSEDWNYRIKSLAEGVSKVLPGVRISINKDAEPDKRSYKVDFSLFSKLAPKNLPIVSLKMAVEDLVKGLKSIGFNDANFRNSNLIRLNVLRQHISSNSLNNNLEWIK